MTIEAKYTTVSGTEKVVRVEAGQQFPLGKQSGEEAYLLLVGSRQGGVAIPHDNWGGEPGQPVVVRPGEIKELYFHPWQGSLNESPGSDERFKVRLTGL